MAQPRHSFGTNFREENGMNQKYKTKRRGADLGRAGWLAIAVLAAGSSFLSQPCVTYAASAFPTEMVSAGLDVSSLDAEDHEVMQTDQELEAEITKEALSVPRTMVGDLISSQVEEAYIQPMVISCSQQDYDVLLRIVEAEAGICDYQGKLLVANVVINRVESGSFPNTVTEVVYQENQFSPVKSGSINSVTVSEETRMAVDAALAGEDPSCGALFFAARQRANASNMSWFDSHLRFLFEHDGHEFFTLP